MTQATATLPLWKGGEGRGDGGRGSDDGGGGGLLPMSLPSLPLWFAGLCLCFVVALSQDNTTAFFISYTKGPACFLRARGWFLGRYY